MLCYKDITWCCAKDCENMDCFRNTKGKNFNPDDYWKERVSVAPFQNWCRKYKKKENKEVEK